MPKITQEKFDERWRARDRAFFETLTVRGKPGAPRKEHVTPSGERSRRHRGNAGQAARAYIVLLEPGVWLAEGDGDPSRTTSQGWAREFKTRGRAERAIAEARQYRPFADAQVVPVE